MEKNKIQHLNITTDKLFDDIRNIIEQGRRQAYAATNQIVLLTYGTLGGESWRKSSMEKPVHNMVLG